MGVVLQVKSKRYNCEMELKDKVTFILGDSGVGKTDIGLSQSIRM